MTIHTVTDSRGAIMTGHLQHILGVSPLSPVLATGIFLAFAS